MTPAFTMCGPRWALQAAARAGTLHRWPAAGRRRVACAPPPDAQAPPRHAGSPLLEELESLWLALRSRQYDAERIADAAEGDILHFSLHGGRRWILRDGPHLVVDRKIHEAARAADAAAAARVSPFQVNAVTVRSTRKLLNYMLLRWALARRSVVLHAEALSSVYTFGAGGDLTPEDDRRFPHAAAALEDERTVLMSVLETPGAPIARRSAGFQLNVKMHFTERQYRADVLERTRSRYSPLMTVEEAEAGLPHAMWIRERIPFLRNLGPGALTPPPAPM